MLHSGAPRAPERAPGAQIPLGTVASKRQIRVGDVPIGGGAPVAVQSMTKTETADYEATMRQIHAVAEAGGDLVRCAVPRDEDVRALERENAVEALVAAAIEHVELMERLRFEDFKVSVKSTSVPNTIASNRLLAERIDYPLHLGITEAGTKWSGSLKSAVGLGTLLADGVGDTIRISLSTFHAEEEVKVAWEILKALKLRERGPVLIACPTCGRLQFDMDTVVAEIEEENAGELTPERIAAMEAAAASEDALGGNGKNLPMAGSPKAKRITLDEEASPTAGRRFTRA